MNSAVSSSRSDRVLVVDDDATSREMLALLLETCGFEVETASDGMAAAARLRDRSEPLVDIVFTDVHMPRMDGFGLLKLVNAEFPLVATVMVTANQERELVSASLRAGAVEFLDKPFDMQGVLRSALRACELHRQRVNRAEAERRLSDVADIHRRLACTHQLDRAGLPARLALHARFRTLNEAGGDFVKAVVRPPNRLLLVLGDVSGHGLKEGFVAAYFQGVIEGMGLASAEPRQIAEVFNRFLQERWNEDRPLAVNTSVSACFAELDFEKGMVAVRQYGGAPAGLLRDDGRYVPVPGGGCPLGWFDRPMDLETLLPLPDRGSFWLWSDGLESQAERLGVPPLALAWRLHLAGPEVGPDPFLAEADDDIVSCRLEWRRDGRADCSSEFWCFLHSEELPGDALGRIDAELARLKRMFECALPGVSPERMWDLGLVLREGLINAFQHGCGGEAGRRARLEVWLSPGARRLRLRIADNGPGFDPASPPAPEDPEHVSLGLRIMTSLTDALRHEDGGRSVTVELILFPDS